MAVGAVGDGASIEALGHKNEVPFARPSPVDDVFPGLRRQALREICPQSANSGGSVERRVSRVLRVPRLCQPELHIVAEELPDPLCDLVEMTIAGAVAVFRPHTVVEPVTLVFIAFFLGLIGDEGGVAAEIKI